LPARHRARTSANNLIPNILQKHPTHPCRPPSAGIVTQKTALV
jgi:hypothetical protein